MTEHTSDADTLVQEQSGKGMTRRLRTRLRAFSEPFLIFLVLPGRSGAFSSSL